MNKNSKTTSTSANRIDVSVSPVSISHAYVLQEFAYNKDYFKIPGCPPPHETLLDAGFNSEEVDAAWIAFRKYAEKCVTTYIVNFSEECNFRYNIKNGYISVGTNDVLCVLKSENIEIQQLNDIGFKLDTNLAVPFSEHEAYFDKENEALLAWW